MSEVYELTEEEKKKLAIVNYQVMNEWAEAMTDRDAGPVLCITIDAKMDLAMNVKQAYTKKQLLWALMMALEEVHEMDIP